jgi:hypothetical protein
MGYPSCDACLLVYTAMLTIKQEKSKGSKTIPKPRPKT